MTDEPDDLLTTEPAAAEPAKAKKAHHSVVYVHGIGSQRRYEETSRVVDRLDQYARTSVLKQFGSLVGIRARVEPRNRDPKANEIGYINVVHSGAGGRRVVRFYEAYWAPVMADVTSAKDVLKWLFTQPSRPWKTLLAPWRERQRLRRSSLVALFEASLRKPTLYEDDDFRDLLKDYYEFEGMDAQRDHAEGSFSEFLAFVGGRHKDAVKRGRMRALAETWRATYRGEELRNMVALTTMALGLVLVFAGLVLVILNVLELGAGLSPVAALLEKTGTEFTPTIGTALAMVIFLAGAFNLSRALTDYLGDVQAWATYEETDAKHVARRKALDECMAVLTHVLRDETCERVTVVAHSLGTSIAHDALLALERRNQARRPIAPEECVDLTKIRYFVTMGSPIDKIEYFFESYASRSHRYKRVVEALRGDISHSPFTVRGKPYIHWINFWDDGDPISGALHSPAGAEVNIQRVDNVHVASLWFPAPGGSHSGYFDHRTVIAGLFRIIFLRPPDFADAKSVADYQDIFLPEGDPTGGRAVFLRLAGAVPWLALAGALAWGVAWLFDIPSMRPVGMAAGGLALAIAVFLGVAYRVSRHKGQRTPI